MTFNWLHGLRARIAISFSFGSNTKRSRDSRRPVSSNVAAVIEMLEARKLLTPVIANVETATYHFTVNAPATPITSTLTLTNSPTQLVGATVQLEANYASSEDVLTYPARIGNITGNYDASIGKIAFTGTDSLASYQAALRSVTYQDTSSHPSTMVRRFNFSVSDAAGQSSPAYRYFQITSMISNVQEANTSYTEGDPATVVSNQLVFAPTASGTITSASIRMDANYVKGEDVLGFIAPSTSSPSASVNRPRISVITPKISGVWNPSTGTLTLTAAPSQTPVLADFQAALRSVTYTNTSQNPSTSVRRFAIWTNDGDSPTLDGYSYFNITAVNTPPTIITPNSITTPEETPLAIKGLSFAVVDAGSGIETATFNVAHGVLSLGKLPPAGLPVGSIVGNNSGSLRIKASISNLNAMASGLKYLPLPFYNGADTLSIQINDNGNTGIGGSLTASASTAITVTHLNRPPTIVSPGPVTTAENTSVVITGMSFSDPDGGSANETVTLSVSQGTLTLNSMVNEGLAASQITGNGTGTISITAPLAAMNATMTDKAGLTYLSNLDYSGNDTLAIGINDNGNSGPGGPSTASSYGQITVTPVNKRPVVSNLETAAYYYTEKDPATVISNQVIVADVDNVTLASGTVSVDANYTAGEDVLSFTPNSAIMGNIAIVSNSGGTLNLVSAGATATTANWQAAFQAVTYTNTSSNPNTAVRRFLFQVNDGSLYSLPQYRWFTVTAVTPVNAPPTITAPKAATAFENTALVIHGVSFADPDAGSASETLTLFSLSGVLTLSTTVPSGLTASQITGNGTGKLSIMAPLAALNATMADAAGLTYLPKLNFKGTDVLYLDINDNGNSGFGGALGASVAIRLTVASVT